MESYWENGHPHPVKYESEAAVAGFPYCETGLNFSTSTTAYSEDDTEYTPGRRGKTSRQDPLSHRIIEKRRRDRMNSCLADLSRLIPPQYLRKGRGRVEKTEIIEMAIRHMKHLQNQEYTNKETNCGEQYRQGYEECLSEAAKFLLSGHLKDICCQMVDHLKDHCNEIMKGDYLKSRSLTDTNSASSESPNGYHNTVPLNQLRDMITSDVEHSNDQHDVKDLSFRTQQQKQQQQIQPQQAAIITSTAPINVHLESSDHDTDLLSRASSTHTEHSHHQQQSHENIKNNNKNNKNNNSNSNNKNNSVLRTVRMRKLSETSTDIEHNNNNYKFKNYIQQRFSQDNHHQSHLFNHHHLHHHLHDNDNNNNNNYNSDIADNLTSNISNHNNIKKRKAQQQQQTNDSIEYSSCDEKPTTNGIQDIKSEHTTPNINSNNNSNNNSVQQLNGHSNKSILNGNGVIGNGINGNGINGVNGNGHSFAVPIFALHAQGTFYVPMNIDYEAILPYLGRIDLLDKNFNSIPPLHPININVSFGHALMKSLQRPKLENMLNGW